MEVSSTQVTDHSVGRSSLLPSLHAMLSASLRSIAHQVSTGPFWERYPTNDGSEGGILKMH